MEPPAVGASSEETSSADVIGGSAPPAEEGAIPFTTPAEEASAGVEAPSTPSTEAIAADAAAGSPGSTGAVATDGVSTETAPADLGTSAGTMSPDAAATGTAEAATGTVSVGTEGAGTGEPLKSDRIQLTGESGQSISVGVRTPLGKHMVRQFGEDSNVWDTEQCTLERGADGAWQVVPAAGTTNETLVNGEPVTGPRPLREGDVLAVGRAEKGIVRLPLTVRAG